MKERPILFSAPMVRAIIAGRKSQTRRIVKPQPPERSYGLRPHKIAFATDDEGENFYAYSQSAGNGGRKARNPYGQPGDRLWVRETWQEFFDDEIPEDRTRVTRGRMGIPAEPDRLSYVAYRADGEMPDHEIAGEAIWKPSIFMPRWASRITLEIVGVRVERVQEIGEGDAIKEGFPPLVAGFGGKEGWARDRFQCLWDQINGKRAPWASNPWVWAIEFRRIDL